MNPTSSAPAFNDPKLSAPNTPSAQTAAKTNRFQVQPVIASSNPPPPATTATASANEQKQINQPPIQQQQPSVEKKMSGANLSSTQSTISHGTKPLTTNSAIASDFTLELLDSELRKVSGVQSEVVANGSPHLVHATNQTSQQVAPPQPVTQVPPPTLADSYNPLAELNEKLAQLTNKQIDHVDGTASTTATTHRPGLSRAGSVIPEDFAQSVQSSTSIPNSSAGTVNPSMTNSTILPQNVPLESLNDLASALQRVSK